MALSISPRVLAVILGFLLLAGCRPAAQVVTILRVPDGGRMPQAAVDADGTIHLMYFQGAMTGGDLFYVRRALGDDEWSRPLRVNSEPRASIGMGPMDGGDLALAQTHAEPSTGLSVRLHAVWFRPDPVRFFYTRSTDGGLSFEPQRVLWELGDELVEARPSIAAGDARSDDVFVAWHGATVEGADDARRAVFLMASTDGGETFAPPKMVSDPSAGACGCCSLETFASGSGLFISFRGAGDNRRRGQRLLAAFGGPFVEELLQPWELGACPVTTTTFAQGPDTARVAWETEGQVYFAPIYPLGDTVEPEGEARFRRKNPAIATNKDGQTLLAWGDAPGYRAGGTLHWQIFDRDGGPLSEVGPPTDTIASGSGPAAVAMPDGTFRVIY